MCQNQLESALSDLINQLNHGGWQQSPGTLLPVDIPLPMRHQITVEWLQDWCFIHAMGLPTGSRQPWANQTKQGLDVHFTHDLHQSNAGSGYWEEGWQVEAIDPDGVITVAQFGLQLAIERDRHLLPTRHDYQVGDRVNVRMPRNRVEEDFYVAIGDAGIPQGDCVEIFLHLNLTGAIPFMGQITSDLNPMAIPFRCALSYRPEAYPRRDVGVLQIAGADYPIVRSWLADYYPQLQAHLQPEVPLFSQAIAPGIGLIERADPAQQYQRYRCLAEAILASYLAVDGAPLAITPVIEPLVHNLTVAGFDLEHLYRNPGSSRDYPAIAHR
jgi:HopA1 effector protein family